MLKMIKHYIPKNYSAAILKNAEDAYDLWSKTYDFQPDNLMLELDNLIFSQLIQTVNIEGKVIGDIGCGTGRHWQQLIDGHPKSLTGFDLSEGMLKRLKEKFPTAIVKKILDNSFREEEDGHYDIIISTLTIAHIKNVYEALQAWSRILKKGADIIITDFHPNLLARGGKRTFTDKQQQFTVVNYVHSTDKLKKMFRKQNFFVVKEIEIKIDESLRSYYEKQNAIAVFNQFKGVPVIYGLHLKKHDSQ
jgi:ubiquinone/menaquinone biosynthesis C-methylase UbiE